MNESPIEKISKVFCKLSNPTRLKIMLLCLKTSYSVGALTDELELSQSLVSHHLKQLRDANLIQSTRQGKNKLYHVKDECMQCILTDMVAHIIGTHKTVEKK